MSAITGMCTFDMVSEIPDRQCPLATKWVWTTKRNIKGDIEKFKARWVARGDLQKKGLDYNESFAPVASLATLRMVLAIVAKQDLEIDQGDVISTFLNGKIDTLVFLLQPEGFKLGLHKYCRLNKTIYGLCQSARMWYSILNGALMEFGFISKKNCAL